MAENTPESDLGSIECFQNYTAPEVFIQGLAGIVDQQDVEAMIRAQKQMLQRFEKTNEMLTNCNALSVSRLKTAGTEFKKHTQLLLDMKKDLDNIFKRIRVLKTKLASQYPEGFEAASGKVESAQSSTAVTAQNNDSEASEQRPQEGASAVPKEGEEEAASTSEGAVAEAGAAEAHQSEPGVLEAPLPDVVADGYSRLMEDADTPERRRQQRMKRSGNSSSTESPNGHSQSQNESSPCTSDTG